jgi:hypothetical protein
VEGSFRITFYHEANILSNIFDDKKKRVFTWLMNYKVLKIGYK